jgi:putative hydrolase of the HAD superfamily
MVRERAAALLIDLDGVVRVFDPAVAAAAERRHDLPDGELYRIGFAWGRLRPAIVGEQTHEEWLDAVVAELAATGVEPAAARAAVDDWQADRGRIVPDALEFVRELRAARIPVGLATNATSRLDADLAALGIAGEFDVVVNSSVIGAHKPTREFFATACAAVATPPARCFFVDDDDRHVRGARVAGLSGYRWNGPADLPYLRAALAIPAG